MDIRDVMGGDVMGGDVMGGDVMGRSVEVSNRELLRNFKFLKEKLMIGEVQTIRVPQTGTGKILKITIEKEMTPFERQLKRLKEFGPIKIERPEADLFDYLD